MAAYNSFRSLKVQGNTTDLGLLGSALAPIGIEFRIKTYPGIKTDLPAKDAGIIQPK